jgi:hypothetical protein
VVKKSRSRRVFIGEKIQQKTKYSRRENTAGEKIPQRKNTAG